MSGAACANAATAASKFRCRRQQQQHLRRCISIQRQHQPQHYLRGSMKSAYASTQRRFFSFFNNVDSRQRRFFSFFSDAEATTQAAVTFGIGDITSAT
jgi:hypothetical protein